MSDENKSQDEMLIDALYGELGIASEQSLKSMLENDAESKRTLEQLSSAKVLVDALPELRPDPQVHYSILRAAREAVQEPPARESLIVRLLNLFQTPAFAAFGLFIVGGTLFAVYTDQIREGEQAQSMLEQSNRERVPKREIVSRDKPAARARTAAGKVAETAINQLPVVELDAPEAQLGSSAVGQMEIAQLEPKPETSSLAIDKAAGTAAKGGRVDSDMAAGSMERAIRAGSARKAKPSRTRIRRTAKKSKPAKRVAKRARPRAQSKNHHGVPLRLRQHGSVRVALQ